MYVKKVGLSIFGMFPWNLVDHISLDPWRIQLEIFSISVHSCPVFDADQTLHKLAPFKKFGQSLIWIKVNIWIEIVPGAEIKTGLGHLIPQGKKDRINERK